MKILALVMSVLRLRLVKTTLFLTSLMFIALPASALSFNFGNSVPNPQFPGGTLTGTSNFSITSTMSMNLTVADIGGPVQVFLAAYVPAGTLGLTANTWFVNVGGSWQQVVNGTFLPLASGVGVGTWNISVLGGISVNALPACEVYVGYGLSAQEMLQASRYKAILIVH